MSTISIDTKIASGTSTSTVQNLFVPTVVSSITQPSELAVAPLKGLYAPGVYDISIEDYHSSQAISRSGIMQFKRSPLHYFSSKIYPREETQHMVFGNAVHTYILECDQFNDRYFIAPKVNRTTKVGKQQWEEAVAEAGSRTILQEDVFNDIQSIAKAFRSEPLAHKLIENANFEKSIFWEDEESGLMCKARPDIWQTNMICDLKTASDASLPEFSKAMANYGYHIQAAMIRDALRAVCNQDIDDFAFIVIEKSYPFAIGVYLLDKDALEIGAQEYKFLLKQLKQYTEQVNEKTTRWPGYKAAVAKLPGYYMSAC